MIELLVVIAVIAILAAILFPVFARVREKARQANCASNLHQLGVGVSAYIQDYDETFPFVLNGSANWTKDSGGVNTGDNGKPVIPGATGQEMQFQLVTVVAPYVKNRDVWYCPSVSRDWVWEYAVKNGWWTKGARMRDQSTTYSYNYAPCPWHNFAVYTFMGSKSLAFLRDSTHWPLLWDEPHGHSNNALDPPANAVPHSGGLNVAYGDGHVKFYRMGTTGLEGDYRFEHSGDGLYPNQ